MQAYCRAYIELTVSLKSWIATSDSSENSSTHFDNQAIVYSPIRVYIDGHTTENYMHMVYLGPVKKIRFTKAFTPCKLNQPVGAYKHYLISL